MILIITIGNISIFRNKLTLVVVMNASNNQSESDSEEAVSSPSIGESPMVTNGDTNDDKVPDDSTATSSACKETSA